MITDTHCHLTCDELYENAVPLIESALEQGVDLMMIMCTNRKEYDRTLALKKQYPENLKVAWGFFPEDAREITEEDLEELRKEAACGNMDVLGEIGLDYYWDTSFKEEQKALFKAQLDIAAETGLPVSIHMRDAAKDSLDILKAHARTPIIFHCYSGSTETMREALKLDSMISFAGPITFKNNKQGPANVIACPPERILSETDSPYLAPVPYRGKRNQPAYVKATLEKMAELKEMDSDDLARQIPANFLSLFQNGSE